MRVCLHCAARYQGTDWACPSCGWRPACDAGVCQFAPEFESANSGFKAEYFGDLVAREAGHFWFESRNRLLEWAIRRYAPDARDYLEVGCGTGFVLSAIAERFPQLRLCGSEIFTAGLRQAQRRVPRAEFLQLDARHLPFEREFDLLGAFDVIEHIDEDAQVLASMHGALREGGVLVLTVPQHPWLWSAADSYAQHKRRYSRRELLAKLQAAGFELLKVTSFVSLLLPLMGASRLMQRNTRVEDYDPADEFNIHPVMNAALRSVLSLEVALIRCGLSLPAGGSLLAVARKKKQA
jgi:SAM-dependent methyltransferase